MNKPFLQFAYRIVFILCIVLVVAGVGVPVCAGANGIDPVAVPSIQDNVTVVTPTNTPVNETTTVSLEGRSNTSALTSSGVNASGLATSSADFFIQSNYEADTDTDSISSGVQPMRYWGGMKIENSDDDSNTVLGNITMEVTADDITGVEYSDEPGYSVTWNGTHAKWKFPSDLYIGEGKAVSTTWDTDYSYSQYIPMSMKRSINKTIFASDGYQLVTFNVTFENSTYTTIWGVISAEETPLEYVDATLLTETFTTDAPIKSFDTARNTNNYFAFWLDPNRVELGKPYQFSMVIRVNVTTPDASAVKYTPRCAIGLSTHTSSGTIGTGYTASMPSGALPPHANSASVSTNLSNSWTYSSGFIQKMAFMEVCQKLNITNIGVFRPSTGYWYLDYNFDGTVDKAVKFGSTGDTPVIGNWSGTGITGIGVFRPTTGYWYLDYTNDGTVDKAIKFGTNGDRAIAGDWNNAGHSEIGVFRLTTGYWYLDYNFDGTVDKAIKFGKSGDTPLVGDFNADGTVDIGVFRPSTGYWYLDYIFDGNVDKTVKFGTNGDTPIVGDWNNAGHKEIGVFRPSTGYWYLDYNFDGTVDKAIKFGKSGDTPLVGDFNADGTTDIGVFRPSTGYWYLDYNFDGTIDKSVKFGTNGDTPKVGHWV